MSEPTLKQKDDAAVQSVRDIMTDAMKAFQPTTRALLLQQLNGAMQHICDRIEALQVLEAPKPTSQEKTDATQA